MRTLLVGAVAMTALFPALSLMAADLDMRARDNATDVLAGLVGSDRTPGVQYVHADRERILFEYHSGLADIARSAPVERHTTFNGYSVAKTFTAAAVVKLAQQGKLDLDDPISKYVADFPYKESPTIKQTLQHTGGFPNPNPMSWIHLATAHSSFDRKAFVHEVVHNNSGLRSSPGDKFSYSNIGYLLLGEMISKASGMPFEEYVVKEIIQPLRLADGKRLGLTVGRLENQATGYIRRWNWLNGLLGWFIDRDTYLGPPVQGWVPFKPFYVNGAAYGGLIGNADGFIAYLQAMLNRTPPFDQQMVDRLWTLSRTNDGESGPTGLAWFHGTLNGQRYFQHSGGAGGYYCEIRVYPDVGRASVIMTNATGISRKGYLDQVDRFFVEEHEHNEAGRS